MKRIIVIFCLFIIFGSLINDYCVAQIHVAAVRPDRAAPGMNVVIEVLTGAADFDRPFGYDSLYDILPDGDAVSLVNPQDSNRVIFGPPEVSWSGRMIQIPIIILPNASLGPVRFFVESPANDLTSDTIAFVIDSAKHLGPITHDTTIGGGSFGLLSAGNTIIVDSLIVTNSIIHFSLVDAIDTAGNRRYQPMIVLSKGPVRITNSTISVDARGIDGGPGGGGGGHGFPGAGGVGFTGGGSCPSDSEADNGSDSASTLDAGGRASTGVAGGGSDASDQGGGGGTGLPFGISGSAGAQSLPSFPGGFGGGSGGGELSLPLVEYGGGGGGFGTAGIGGSDPSGNGANGGNKNGGRFLVPFAGGSGGGAGNSNSLTKSAGGSGGGGAGAIALIGYDSIILNLGTLAARGDSGTMGIGQAGGGGGGSGGAIYIASQKGISASNSLIAVDGGRPGSPGDLEDFGGGAGGLGRIRIDGPSNLAPNIRTESVWTRGISISPIANVPTHGFVLISGFAPDTVNTLDSIRIYYRTRHTGWSFTDTIRAADGSWSKWLPLTHDSLLFAVALVMVNDPEGANYNYEPSWLMSHAGMAVIRHQASPYLVAIDTLDFGTVRISRCKTLSLKVENEGEEPLVLQGSSIIGSPDFTLISDTPITIQPYAFAEIEVQYCPTVSGPESDTLSILSNDSLDLPKLVTLTGNGLARNDSLVILGAPVTFGRVLIGQCESDTLTLRSAGKDTLYLDSSAWSDSPFSIKIIPPDTALAKGETRLLIVTFCPLDSGDFISTRVLDEREDSIKIDGRGVLRLASSIGSVDLGASCLGNAITLIDTISILGNDTMTFVCDSSILSGIVKAGAILLPGQKYPVAITWKPDSTGSFSDTIFFRMADTTLISIVSFRVDGPVLRYDSALPFHFVCVGMTETDSVILSSSGLDTVSISNFHLSGVDTVFHLLDSAMIIPPSGNISIHLDFTPRDTLAQTDTLRIIASSSGCDSAISIALAGIGITSGLAAEPVDFGSVAVGQCLTDSMYVDNPCGPAAVIDSVFIRNSSFTLTSPLPDTIPSDGSKYIYFRFCPDTAGAEADTVNLFPDGGTPFISSLKGIGFDQSAPSAYFTISRVVAQAGSQAYTTLTFDSSSLADKHPIKGAFVFDPEVLSFEGFNPFGAQLPRPDSATFSYDNFNFSSPGTVGFITWNTLVGPHNSSSIGLVLTTDTPLTVHVNDGEVTVTDCFGLDGNLSVGGPYSLGPINPDPAFDQASATLVLGNSGYVEAKIYDMTGREIETVLEQNFERGTYNLTIPTDGLSSGRYMMVIALLGWRAANPFVIDR